VAGEGRSREIVLGERTSTGDAEGDPLPGGSVPDDVEAKVAALVGAIELRVPAASAVKIDGARAYRLHRRGVDVEMPLRRSTVFSASVLRRSGPRLTLELHVSSGTYVRAIADALGGHCASLRRTAVGPFRVEAADPDRLVPAADALSFLEAIELDVVDVPRVARGLPVPAAGQGAVRLLHRGRLVAVARAAGGTARPETVLGAA
jgi:tRNA pseudouridine55 synthase